MDQVKFFKDCLPQILLGPFLNTLTHVRQVFKNGPRKFCGIQPLKIEVIWYVLKLQWKETTMIRAERYSNKIETYIWLGALSTHKSYNSFFPEFKILFYKYIFRRPLLNY